MTQKSVAITINVHGLGPEAATASRDELFGKLAHGRYAYRVGIDAILDRLHDLQVPATFFWPATEALRCPEKLLRTLHDGHEVALHGNAFEDVSALSREREAGLIAESIDTLQRIGGVRPVGFRSPTGFLTKHTISLLQAQRIRYDSSFVDDDSPYSLRADGGTSMVELPLNESLCDATHFRRRFTMTRAEAAFNEEFGPLLEEDGYACLVFHPRTDIGIARDARLPLLDRLVQFGHDHGAAFLRCSDIADRALREDGTVHWHGVEKPGLPDVDYLA